MQRSEVTKLVRLLVKAFPHSKADEETVQIYERQLQDLDLELAQKAVARLLNTAEFLPTIARIRSECAALTLGPVRTGADAWLDIEREIRRVGWCGRPTFTDPIIADIVARWGWRDLCCSAESSTPADRARFVEAYNARASLMRADKASGIELPEPGRHELRAGNMNDRGERRVADLTTKQPPTGQPQRLQGLLMRGDIRCGFPLTNRR